MRRFMWLLALPALLPLAGRAQAAEADKARIEFRTDEKKGQTEILLDGKQALVFNYGDTVDLPHYYPVNSPSGKSMTLQKAVPPALYPHHRSFWFADDIHLDGGKKVSFYNALYSGVARKDPPFTNHTRQVEFKAGKVDGNTAEYDQKLVWEMDKDKPAMDEARHTRMVALGNGEYFLDMKFTLTSSYGDAEFDTDAVHYAWPFIRMALDFTPTKGGKLVNSEGGVGQAGTHDKVARWVDYSNTLDGQTEGLAMFCRPEYGDPVKWLTRDYGCFGPRRVAEKSGKKFTLKKGETIEQRVGVLIHRGDAESGKIAERYQQYLDGKL